MTNNIHGWLIGLRKFCLIKEIALYGHIHSRWQQLWNTETNNKLHGIEPMNKSSKPFHLRRRNKLIGHTHLTHAFLLMRNDLPECIGCQASLMVEHILLKCLKFQLIREKYFISTNLSYLFNNVPSRAVVDFIKEIGLYWKLWILTKGLHSSTIISFTYTRFFYIHLFLHFVSEVRKWTFSPIMFAFSFVFLLIIILPYVI